MIIIAKGKKHDSFSLSLALVNQNQNDKMAISFSNENYVEELSKHNLTRKNWTKQQTQ